MYELYTYSCFEYVVYEDEVIIGDVRIVHAGGNFHTGSTEVHGRA